MWMLVNEWCFKKQQVVVRPLLICNLVKFRYSSSGMVKDIQIGNQQLLSLCYKAYKYQSIANKKQTAFLNLEEIISF